MEWLVRRYIDAFNGERKRRPQNGKPGHGVDEDRVGPFFNPVVRKIQKAGSTASGPFIISWGSWPLNG
jgi:hypothetical protein